MYSEYFETRQFTLRVRALNGTSYIRQLLHFGGNASQKLGMPPHMHTGSELLEAYASGSLSEEDVKIVEEHLLVCEACRQGLTAAEEDRTVLRSALRAQECEEREREPRATGTVVEFPKRA
ncbi:MAG: zf-HC2 domain-containing protein [Acidobacteriaceae bacterium]|nr:zf-HC2 domain-containing protein [Acidobacteriaceae bacterium]